MSATALPVAVELLFAGTPSVSFAETVAVFDSGPVALTEPWMVMVTLAPLAIVPTAQVTVVVPLHEPCVDDAESKVKLAGSGSETATPVAVPGPWLTI